MDQVLSAQGRLLQADATLQASGLSHGCTVHLTGRLLGGKPVKVGGSESGGGTLCGPGHRVVACCLRAPRLRRRCQQEQEGDWSAMCRMRSGHGRDGAALNLGPPGLVWTTKPCRTTAPGSHARPARQVKIITPHLECGSEVTIDIGPDATKDEIRQKLVTATGVPFEHQKVMLSGINQIVMGDKRWVGDRVPCLAFIPPCQGVPVRRPAGGARRQKRKSFAPEPSHAPTLRAGLTLDSLPAAVPTECRWL